MDEEPIKDWEEDDNVIQGNGNSFLVRPISGLLLGDLKASAGIIRLQLIVAFLWIVGSKR